MSMAQDTVVPAEPVREANETYDLRFSEVRSYLLGVARSLVGDDAEDVVQDTYLIGRRRLGQLRDQGLLRAWLTAIVVNQCYDRHRRRRRLKDFLERSRPSAPASSDLDLRAGVEALPYRDRTVVVLHYGHGLSLEEIALILGAKPATIRSVLFRARARLRRVLSDDAPTQTGGIR
jgi:RNA polymerase sigma factor (sigma-70 family)